MKRAVTLLFVFLLVACGGVENNANDNAIEKREEMTETAAINYLGQVTQRLIEANREDDGSFEQKSSLQAAKGKSDSIIEEIEEEYESELSIAQDIIEIADYIKWGAEKALGGDYDTIEINLLVVQDMINEFSDEYLNGEVPTHLKYLADF